MSVVSLSAERRARMGLSHAMEGRRIFKQLTVEENLELAWVLWRPHAELRNGACDHL